MARMNAFIHDMEAEIALGDTMRTPALSPTGDGSLRRFDLVTANPMWNQKFAAGDLRERHLRAVRPRRPARLQRRLGLGAAHGWPRWRDTGAWPWCWTPARSAGAAATRARTRARHPQGVRRADLIEAVLLLPENLFYNTTAPGIILVVNRQSAIPARSC